MAEIVWVIDDCPLTTKLVKARLRTLGTEVHTLPTGNAAVAAWVGDTLPKPTVILLDLNMPGIDGIAAGELLRDAGYPGLLLLHTDTAGISAATDRVGDGFDGVMLKPIDCIDLQHMLCHAEAKRLPHVA